MSIEYLVCDNCGETFPDIGYFVRCDGCGTTWCSDECAEEDGFKDYWCSKFDIIGLDKMEEYRDRNCRGQSFCVDCLNAESQSCKYCREEDFEDHVLLEKALELLNMGREDLINICRKKVKKNDGE